MKYLDTELLKRTLDSVFEGRRILSSERIEEMSTPQAPFSIGRESLSGA